jgi:aspartate racemase
LKTLGMIGGVGPESTVDYYQRIVSLYRERNPDGSYPLLIINSVDLTKGRALIDANDRSGLTKYLVEEIQKLVKAGADFGLIAANTPHIVFNEVARESPIPLISIVEATCAAAKARGLKSSACSGRVTPCRRSFSRTFFRRKVSR